MNEPLNIDGITLSEEQNNLFDRIENSKDHFFITGKAGTGKSILLRYFKARSKKKLVVGAYTGVASLNIGAQTLNSLFNLPFGHINTKTLKVSEKIKTLLRHVDTIVIDEISMVRADMMDAIDFILRRARGNQAPFGGVQMVFFGDLYQLQPIVTDKALQQYFADNHGGSYFFNALVWKNARLDVFELVEVFRQKDQFFRNLLDRVRKGDIDEETLLTLNKRMVPNLSGEGIITLTSTNNIAESINYSHLNMIQENMYEYNAVINGKFESSSFPADGILSLKKGAQVMCLNNDQGKKWVNGTIGTIESLSDSLIQINVNEHIYPVSPHTWEKKKYHYNKSLRKIEEETVATFTQFPLRLAWAITIHKSQGKTYNDVIINLGTGAFTHGQTYVALSRCSTFEGIFLKQALSRKDIIVDVAVIDFMSRVRINEP